MPYSKISELPDSVKDNLPQHACEIDLAAFNNARENYKNAADRRGDSSRDEAAHKVAWPAVKKKYEKSGNQWKAKN